MKKHIISSWQMKLTKKPHNILLFAGIVLMLLSFFVTHDNTLKLTTHDTYLTIPYAVVVFTSSILLLVFWLLCLVTHSIIYSQKLAWGHVILTVFTISALLACLFINIHYSQDIVTNSSPHMANNELIKVDSLLNQTNLSRESLLLFLIFIIGQTFLIINLTVGIFKRVGLSKLF